MTNISDVIKEIKNICPESIQEKWDNSGLQVGDTQQKCTGILLALDVTMAVVDEAIEAKLNLIVAHHPILFSPLKSLDKNGNSIQKILYKCIEKGISIYTAHTNWDKVANGVSKVMANKLGLLDSEILLPETGMFSNVRVMGTPEDVGNIQKAWFDNGLGNIGQYSNCSFTVDGIGTFMPSVNANPSIGSADKTEVLTEKVIEILCNNNEVQKAIEVAKKTSSYETIAHSIIPLNNSNDNIGFGCIGNLKSEMSLEEFLAHCKKTFACEIIKYNPKKDKNTVKKVAVCGGSAIDFVKHAISQKADVYITADVKYHQFELAEGALSILDVGHYESEIWAMDYLGDLLKEKFINFAVRLTTTNTNSVRYF